LSMRDAVLLARPVWRWCAALNEMFLVHHSSARRTPTNRLNFDLERV
jgi:hypothetical protein